MMNGESRITHYVLLAALLAGFALRVHALGAQSFWLDEAYMWGVVKNAQLWDAVKAMLLLNSTTPLGYLVIWLTVPLFGLTEFGLRLSSALIGVLAIPVVYRLGREMFDRNVGTLSGMIIAFMPFVVWFARDAKPYASYLLLSAVSLWGFWRFTRGRGTALLIAASSAWYLSHYVSALFVYAQVMYLWLRLRRQPMLLRQWVLAQSVAVIPVAGWGLLYYFLTHRKLLVRVAWIPPVSLFTPLQTLWNFVSGDAVHWTGVMAVGLVVLLGLMLRTLWARSDSVWLLWAWAVLPIAVGWSFSFIVPSYVDRYFMPAVVPVALLIAVGIGTLPGRWRLTTALALIAMLLVYSFRLFGDPQYAKEDWRSAAELIAAEGLPVGVIDPESATGLAPYLNPQTKFIALQDSHDLSMIQTEGKYALILRSPHESIHALSKTQPFYPLSEGPAFFRRWLEENRSAPIQVYSFTGLAVILVGK